MKIVLDEREERLQDKCNQSIAGNIVKFVEVSLEYACVSVCVR